jgi:NAD(P)-dependent dehydrogenase (short-subunit alcohol dehydrogenase family)
MNIAGSIALVTGANRGIGKAFVDALLAGGAVKIYAGARDAASIADPRVTALELDVTSPATIAAAVKACPDVTLLINNAGVMKSSSMLLPSSAAAMQSEFDVNVFGMLAMIRGFAPVLEANGGGAIVNMLSVVSWFTSPSNSTYCASKHAALAVSDAVRIELHDQHTAVIGVYVGFVDTDMAAEIDAPKVAPRDVAEAALNGVENGINHVRVGERAESMWTLTRSDPEQLDRTMQAAWDARSK